MSGFRAPRGFGECRSGSVALIFVLSIFMLCGMVGLGIDASRTYSVSMRVNSIIDAAALAGAKLFESDDATDASINATVQTYLQTHATNKLLPGMTIGDLQVAIDRVNNRVGVTVEVAVPTVFAQIVGVKKIDFHRSTAVALKMNKIELSMVLDITGSMNDGGKLDALKAASKDVIDSLMTGATSEDSVRIAVAPFSASVNAGAIASKVSASPSVASCGYTWYWGYTCTTSAGADIDTCVIERINSHAFTDAAPSGPDILPAVPYTPYGNYVCPSSKVVPLQGKSQASAIKSTIDSYTAAGATAGHIGAAWGWYLLSPKWAGVLPSASAPADYANANVTKHVILLTDGIFNTAYVSGPSADATTQTNDAYTQFQSLCSNMKAAGLTVYTVALDLTDPFALSELQKCGGANTFTAADGTSLRAVFMQIVSRLNQLRVAS